MKIEVLLKNLLKEDLTKEEVKEIVNLVVDNGGVDEAKKLAHKYINKSYKLIDKLPHNPNKEVLKKIVKQKSYYD